MFRAINYLLHEKKKPELDVELLESFNPVITSKSFSYYNRGSYCDYINDTLNLYGNIFKIKEDQFKFFDNMIPKLPIRRGEYIKKPKLVEAEVDLTPPPEFLSKREVALYKTLTK